MHRSIARFVAVGALVLALGLIVAEPAQAQYIEELPSTTVVDVGAGGVDRQPGTGVEEGSDGSIVATGSDLVWLARLGAVALAAGGVLMLSPARRRRREQGFAAARGHHERP
jgi:hypothetical protein